MCTSIAFFDQNLFGRNLDLEVSFGQRVVIAPRRLAFPFAHRPALARPRRGRGPPAPPPRGATRRACTWRG